MSLSAVLAEWIRACTDHSTRITPLNGTTQADRSVNYLNGSGGLDWYSDRMSDIVFNYISDEVIALT